MYTRAGEAAYTREQAQRDLNPTPEAVFAMYHWHDLYAKLGLGTMGFWDYLSKREKQYCREAVKAITVAKGRK